MMAKMDMFFASLEKIDAVLKNIRFVASSPVAGTVPCSLQESNPGLLPYPIFCRWRWLHGGKILSAAGVENKARQQPISMVKFIFAL